MAYMPDWLETCFSLQDWCGNQGSRVACCTCLDEGAVAVEGIKVIVEDSLADDVQRQLAEQCLHVCGLARVCSSLQQVRQRLSQCWVPQGGQSFVCPERT